MSFFSTVFPIRSVILFGLNNFVKAFESTETKMGKVLTQHMVSQELSDDALLAAIGTGDQAAGSALIKRHLAYVLHICRSKLHNEAEAEEAAQDVFASVWKNAGSWQPGGAKVTTWLYRIASNRCIDLLRRRRPTTDISAIAEPVDETADIEAAHMAGERHRLIKEALGALKQDQRRAIELVYFGEMKQAEAAATMGISLAALESILRRARARLHEELAGMRTALHMV
jgi:RNA polymerase sigma-70 factor (ECF subfamily)